MNWDRPRGPITMRSESMHAANTGTTQSRRADRQSAVLSFRRWRASPGVLAVILASLAEPARATFHFMHIEQVIGGVNGDAAAQAIQLRMRFAQQHLVDRGRIVAYDAAGQNPIVLIDFEEPVANSAAGARVLVASEGFIPHTNPPIQPDFLFTNLLPARYLAAGSIVFLSDADDFVVCRLSWGGAAYTGDTNGGLTNDDDGEFGPPYPDALPGSGVQALFYQADFAGLSSTNAADYALTEGAAVFINNAGAEFTVRVPECPLTAEEDPVDEDGDGVGAFCDECPDDPDKTAPGECGCGRTDRDDDGDGDVDCAASNPDDNDNDDNDNTDNDNPGPGDPTSNGNDNTGNGNDNSSGNVNDNSDPGDSEGGGAPSACGAGLIPPLLLASSLMLGARGRRLLT